MNSSSSINLCETCSYKYFDTIAIFYNNEESSRNFLRAHGVLPKTVNCPNCKIRCSLSRTKPEWRCWKTFKIPKSKKRRYCGFSVSDNKGTFLENARISSWKVVLFVNHFLSHLWEIRTVQESLYLSLSTIVDWRSFCSDVCEHWVKHQDPIGGKGVVVDIDETLIVRRHRSDPKKGLLKNWLYGAVERVTKRTFVIALTEEEPDEKRKEETLLSLVKKSILSGSIIYSDCKKAYGNLQQENYIHFMVNTSEDSLDKGGEEESKIHAQNIEELWFDIKRFVMKPGNSPKYINQYLARYMFIKNENDTTKLLHKFFKRAAMLYKHPSVEEEQQQPAESNVPS